MRHWILYFLLAVVLLYAVGTTVALLLSKVQFIWALPSIVLWLHFGFLFCQRRTPALRNPDETETAFAKKGRMHWWWITWSLFVSAVASTLVLVFGLVFGLKQLPILQFMFFEVLALSASFPAISNKRAGAKQKSGQIGNRGGEEERKSGDVDAHFIMRKSDSASTTSTSYDVRNTGVSSYIDEENIGETMLEEKMRPLPESSQEDISHDGTLPQLPFHYPETSSPFSEASGRKSPFDTKSTSDMSLDEADIRNQVEHSV
ncbi:hypothetical protein NLJ89_g898 [Agrocybe chaxingu]|uniref:Transmembrane protein n=1 Tax=Agrocybe chaxingu TaxID=84603 RepID=A0A9W8TEC9_9AGAR|nr:hypothetical protein NLJ89_g898 [Agrocybe chaxingu]